MPDRLRLWDMSDRELLYVINDCADADGWAEAKDIADAIGLPKKTAANSVGSRMSWMRRFGVVERDGRKWRLTPIGDVLRSGQLTTAQQRQFDNLGDEQLLMAARELTNHARTARPEAATLVNREWRFGT